MIKRRRQQLEEFLKKHGLENKEPEKKSPSKSKEGSRPKDENFKSFERYVEFLLRSDDSFMSCQRQKFIETDRIREKRMKLYELLNKRKEVREPDRPQKPQESVEESKSITNNT